MEDSWGPLKDESIRKVIRLPRPELQGKVSVEEALAQRRSIRRYKSEPLSLEQLSQILWAAQGITRGGGYRTAPSAGATYPLELFAVLGSSCVADLEAGSYHYQVDNHALNRHQRGDFRKELGRAALGQNFVAQAPLSLVLCTIYPRTSYRYGRRGERYVHMEAGHVGQNVHLQVISLGLATVMIGAFDDEEVSQVLELKPEIKPLYIMPVGKSLR